MMRILLIIFMLSSLTASCKEQEFVLFTMPKTGTHLLTPFLEVLTGRLHVGENLYDDLTEMRDYNKYIELLTPPNRVQVHWWLSPCRQPDSANL